MTTEREINKAADRLRRTTESSARASKKVRADETLSELKRLRAEGGRVIPQALACQAALGDRSCLTSIQVKHSKKVLFLRRRKKAPVGAYPVCEVRVRSDAEAKRMVYLLSNKEITTHWQEADSWDVYIDRVSRNALGEESGGGGGFYTIATAEQILNALRGLVDT